jgi:hypothetical protein
MSHENMFSVSRFKNRNGVFSFRVDGRLHGVRIRRNFKTQEEAAAEKAALELKAMQSSSGLQSVTTFLAKDQLREAEAAFRRWSVPSSIRLARLSKSKAKPTAATCGHSMKSSARGLNLPLTKLLECK